MKKPILTSLSHHSSPSKCSNMLHLQERAPNCYLMILATRKSLWKSGCVCFAVWIACSQQETWSKWSKEERHRLRAVSNCSRKSANLYGDTHQSPGCSRYSGSKKWGLQFLSLYDKFVSNYFLVIPPVFTPFCWLLKFTR